MQFDPTSFEYEETPDITIGDGKVGILNILVYAAITIACIFYLIAEWSPQGASPVAETTKTGALS